MKKVISIFMVMILIFSLTACDTPSPEYLLNNFDKFSETVSQMSRREIGDMFGIPPGEFRGEDCHVYLDSWGNGIFIHFKSEENPSVDDKRVEKVEKIKYRKQKLSNLSTKEDVLLHLLNNELGKSEEYIKEKYGEPTGRMWGIYATEHNINDFEVTFEYGIGEEEMYVYSIWIRKLSDYSVNSAD